MSYGLGVMVIVLKGKAVKKFPTTRVIGRRIVAKEIALHCQSASEIGVEELLPSKRYQKNNVDSNGTSEKNYCSGATKKLMGKIKH